MQLRCVYEQNTQQSNVRFLPATATHVCRCPSIHARCHVSIILIVCFNVNSVLAPSSVKMVEGKCRKPVAPTTACHYIIYHYICIVHVRLLPQQQPVNILYYICIVHVCLLPQQQPVTQLFLLRLLTAVLCPCHINHNPTNQIGALKKLYCSSVQI